MGEGRHLGGMSITAIAAYALAFALTICAAPFLASVAFLAQVAACALGMLLDFVGNLSDANLVATENADYYADCLNWLQARLKRIALEMRRLSFRALTMWNPNEMSATIATQRPMSAATAMPMATQRPMLAATQMPMATAMQMPAATAMQMPAAAIPAAT